MNTPRGGPPIRSWLRVRTYLYPALLLLAVTLPHLDQGDWRTDTGRYAGVALQAWEDGYFWTLRTHPDHPWFNKPPLVFWVHGLALRLGGVDLFIARLPTVLAALGSVLSTVWLVRAFHGRGVALAAGLVLALTYEFFRRTREISLDMWQLLFLLLAAGMFARAVTTAHPRRWSAGAGAMLGLALLCKPLVALLALLPLGLWAVTSGRPRRALYLLPVVAVALAVAAPWHVSMAIEHGEAFTGQYFGAEVADRAAGEIRTYPVWYYLREMAGTYWPWAVPLVPGMYFAWRGRLGRSTAGPRLALWWAGVWFVLISVFPDKAPRYALVIYPAFAWVAGAMLAARGAGPMRAWSRRLLTPAVAVGCVAAAVFAALPVRVQSPPEPCWAGLFEAIEAHPGVPVYALKVDTNETGRFRLRGLPWPAPVYDADEVPDGALILRTPNGPVRDRREERVVYHEGPVLLTMKREDN